MNQMRMARRARAVAAVDNGRCPTWTARQLGWSATEYIAVLLGLMAVWRGAQAVLTLVREHHDEFSWALMIPF